MQFGLVNSSPTVIYGHGNLKRDTAHMYNMASYSSVCNIKVTDNGEALECDEC